MRQSPEVTHKETERGVTYTLEVFFDDTDVRGNVIVSGDDAADKEAEDEIIARLDSGDVWAWALIKVTASAGAGRWTLQGEPAYLGGCSYASLDDFVKGSADYWQDLKQEALTNLKKAIREARERGERAADVARIMQREGL